MSKKDAQEAVMLSNSLKNTGLTILLGFVFTACTGLNKQEKDDFPAIIKRFHHNLRWKYKDQVLARIHPTQQEKFLERYDEIGEDLHITSFEIRKVKIDASKDTAKIEIILHYYQMPSTVLRKDKLFQIWSKSNGKWVLVGMEGGPLAVLGEEKRENQEISPKRLNRDKVIDLQDPKEE
jgi:hypothetical protein